MPFLRLQIFIQSGWRLFVIEGGPRPPARVEGNYGQTVGRQTDETWLPYTRGGAWGPGFITKDGALLQWLGYMAFFYWM